MKKLEKPDLFQDRKWQDLVERTLKQSSMHLSATSEKSVTETAFHILKAMESELFEELERCKKSIVPVSATDSRWFRVRCQENSIFAIANLPKKQALVFKQGHGITALYLDQGTFRKNINWLIRELKQDPPEWAWLDGEQAKKYRSLFSRWQTMSDGPFKELTLDTRDRALKEHRRHDYNVYAQNTFDNLTKPMILKESISDSVSESIVPGGFWDTLNKMGVEESEN